MIANLQKSGKYFYQMSQFIGPQVTFANEINLTFSKVLK